MKTPEAHSPKQPFFQILSLDVVLGSLAVGLFAVRLLKVSPNPKWWIILPLAVWVVYTLDHLVDGFKKQGKSVIYRHRFHFRNRKVLTLFVLIPGIAATTMAILFLDVKIIIGGIFLGLIVVLYQGANFSNKRSSNFFFQKELFIAAVYVCGIFLAPVIWYGQALTGERLLIMMIFIGLAFAESVIISWFDFEEDTKDGLSSFSINFGKEETRKIMSVFLAGTAILLLICAWFFQRQFLPFLVILLIMDLILLTVIRRPQQFSKNHLFRWVAESVFILPACIIFF